MQGRDGVISRARARAEQLSRAGLEALERQQEQRNSVRVALDAYHRDRRFAGGLLAGGLSVRVFLWLLPFSLVTATIFQGLSQTLDQAPSELARDVGLSAAVAGTVASAANASGRSWVYLLVLGLVFLVWAGIGVVKATRLISSLAWGMQPQASGSLLRASASLTGVAVVLGVGHQVLAIVGEDVFVYEVLLFVIELAVAAGVTIWVFTSLPHPEDAGWMAMVPGAALMIIGLAGTRVITVIYFAGRLDRVDDLYGALGLASVFLAWLFMLSRLVVAGATLNASIYRSSATV